MNLFENFGLSPELLAAIKNSGFKEPTLIQEKSIPSIMAGKDVIGESATGSGKTLAFGCGIIDKVVPGKGIQALILTPTRELAEQIKDALRQFSRQRSLKIIAVYGGVSIDKQIHDLTIANVVVATPGRMLDHLERRTIDNSKIKILVVDEADRMFDMGFIDDVEKIIRTCPKQRQTMFFSATITPRVKDLAHGHMHNPVIAAGQRLVDPSKLKQVYYNVSTNMKLSLLAHLLQHEKSGLCMVFCNTRRTTDFVVKNLKANSIRAIAIHGGFTQNKRSNNMDMFNDGKIQVLVCTDVAARGLDIDNVSHVYNYEIPKSPKDYIHRIGRTARAGEEGKAINLICERDYENFGRVHHEYGIESITKVAAPAEMKKMRVDRSPEPRESRGRYSGRQGSRPRQGAGRKFSNRRPRGR
ncbi:MAG: DEAD/DEAH box helicase [archaeon]